MLAGLLVVANVNSGMAIDFDVFNSDARGSEVTDC